MAELVAFVLACIDEDERVAERRGVDLVRLALDAAFPGLPSGMTIEEAERRVRAALAAVSPLLDSARVLREAEAQRRLVSLHAEPHECPAWDVPMNETCTGYFGGDEACPTLRLLAQEYGREEPPRPAV